MNTQTNTAPIGANEWLRYEVDELVRYCREDLRYDVEDAMKEQTTDELKRVVNELRRMLNAVEKEIYFPTKDEDEPEAEGGEKDEGPIVILMSDQYWARARSFAKAKANLHGEEPRLMYVTEDPTAYCDGMGSFAYDPRKVFFRVPLGFKVSGPNVGKPGEVEFHAPTPEASRGLCL